ncbi:anti-anti-sigma factor [Pseudomonas sp. J237]|nr:MULTISPECIES: STAS domain-containing protein [Pseudomonas]OEO27062.1 anti-anti-sigma factor [Pseudomonas sp. J237]
MSQASIESLSPGVLCLCGDIDFTSGPSLREQGGKLIAASQSTQVVVNCAKIERSSSVGLSLLLAFMRDAQAAGKSILVRDMPKELHELARVSGLLDILPIET